MAEAGFVKVAQLDELSPGEMMVVEMGDDRILLANVEGNVHAIDDICSHAEAYLHEGVLDGCVIECDAHGARFDIRTGKVEQGPAFMPIDTYQVRVVGDEFEVDL